MPSLHTVIMAGGSGTRFWPASRRTHPKQVLPLADGKPMIAATLDRLEGLCERGNTWIVTNATQAPALREALPGFPPDQILLEPEPRDTAPCIALAAATISARDAGATMLVMPADHLIRPRSAFQEMVRRGAELAADERTLVTFGITPTRPATSFGYIECGDPLDAGKPAACRAVRFREKPDAESAAEFLRAGTFLWNSGIFVWTLPALFAAMQKASAELWHCTEEMIAAMPSGPDAVAEVFGRTPRTSIDYAVMEGAPDIAVVRAEIEWNDVGGFLALDAIGTDRGDDDRALVRPGSDALLLETRGNRIYSDGGRTVCLFGIEDLVVVDTPDAVMVCPKHRADELKRLVEHVRKAGREDLL